MIDLLFGKDDGRRKQRREQVILCCFLIFVRGSNKKMKCPKCKKEMSPFIAENSSLNPSWKFLYICEDCKIQVRYNYDATNSSFREIKEERRLIIEDFEIIKDSQNL